MTTWAGAFVETRGRSDLAPIVERYRIALVELDAAAPWLLVGADINLATLNPPQFAEELSRELHTQVIGFFLQSTASIEQIEHWEDGRLLRKLEYSGDGGGWITRHGLPQFWEPAYFFAEGEGTSAGEEWPHNLGDEVTDDEIARYEQARGKKDATPILDLLSGGSSWSLRQLCTHLGVDPLKPGARFTPKTNWTPRLIVAGIALFFIGMILLGVLSR